MRDINEEANRPPVGPWEVLTRRRIDHPWVREKLFTMRHIVLP